MKSVHRIVLYSCLIFNLPTGLGPVDAQLVDDLLLEDADDELTAPVTVNPPATTRQGTLDGVGEDLGKSQAEDDDWFSTVVKHMQFAQIELERPRNVGQASAAQAAALTELDSLIAELTERKNKWSTGKNAMQSSSESGEKPSALAQAGSNPGKAASSPGSNSDLSTELAAAGKLVKDLWGELPERQREQLLQPLREDFLPKYASEIEAYFRALADPSRTLQETP